MPGLEPGDIAEKVVPLVQFPMLMRVVLPGALATAAIYPFLPFPAGIFRVKSLEDLEQNGLALLALAALVFVLGALIAALNGQIYKLYEGRSYWPARLLSRQTARQQARVNKLQAIKDQGHSSDPRVDARRSEAMDILRTYPTKDQVPYAARPTWLGNILAGYEQYPFDRYGMSSIFYFTRIWMEVEKEKKDAIDSTWSIADGFLSLSATAMAGGALWIAAGILDAFELIDRAPMGDWDVAMLGGLGWLVLGYSLYRISLPFHRQNGELFKSIFDLYRKKVWKMTKIENGEIDAWLTAWRYYQFRILLTCPRCGAQRQPPGRPCDRCNAAVSAFR